MTGNEYYIILKAMCQGMIRYDAMGEYEKVEELQSIFKKVVDKIVESTLTEVTIPDNMSEVEACKLIRKQTNLPYDYCRKVYERSTRT